MRKAGRGDSLSDVRPLFRRRFCFNHTLAKLLYSPCHKYAAAIHAVTQPFTGVAANDKVTVMHHEATHVSHISPYYHHTTNHPDSGARSRISLHAYLAPVNRGARGIARVPAHDNAPALEAFARAPPGAAVDFDRRPVAHCAAVKAYTSRKDKVHRFKQRHAETVPAARVVNVDIVLPLLNRVTNEPVDFSRRTINSFNEEHSADFG